MDRFKTIVLVIALTLVAVFVVVNWTTLTASTTLNLLLFQVQAPLGVLLFVLVGAAVLVYAFLTKRGGAADKRGMTRAVEKASRSQQEQLKKELSGINDRLDQLLSKLGE